MWPGLDKAYDKWAEENIDFKPNGIIDIYIANDDPTGIFDNGKAPDGINVVGGMPDIKGLVGTGDAPVSYTHLTLPTILLV